MLALPNTNNMNDKIIYFSLEKDRAKTFYEYIVEQGICYRPKFSFRLLKPKEEFKDPRDLIPLIEEESKKDSLHIIIDYVSCCKDDKFDDHAIVLRDIIMAYPEVQFLFDETFVINNKEIEENEKIKDDDFPDGNWCFLNFLFQDASIAPINQDNTYHNINIRVFLANEEEIRPFSVLTDWHRFDLGSINNGTFDEKIVKEQFVRMLKGRNNMYDGSNLRCAIKAYKFSTLHVKNNFSKLSDSRRDYAAVVVEEEYQQAMFNGYCLCANGYRVLPVMTATELLKANNDYISYISSKKEGENNLNYIIVRDYDLQFLDEEKGRTSNKDLGTVEIDYIRGAKEWSTKEFKIIPQTGLKDNPYWGKFDVNKTIFVSKGANNLTINLDFEENECRPMCPIVKERGIKTTLKLFGIKKPIEGIYASFHTRKFKEVVNRYYSTLYIDTEIDNIDIKRKGDEGHSCPLNIYGIARSMVYRAEKYYYEERHRLAALVAGEAILILNGFHLELMKKAYYLQAVSENAMAMSLLGGDENKLCDDLILRLKHKVKWDVDRLIRDSEDRHNLLMNIYNDCRLFCREKEYLNAADYALSLMMYEKEGILVPLSKKITSYIIRQRIRKSVLKKKK